MKDWALGLGIVAALMLYASGLLGWHNLVIALLTWQLIATTLVKENKR